MADVTINDLSSLAPTTSDLFPFSTAVSPSTYKASLAQIKTALAIPTAVSQLSNDSGYITSSSLPSSQQLAKAWVNFNGTGAINTNQSMYAFYNVSSVFKISEGCYRINFPAGVFADGNYCCTGAVSMPGSCTTTLHINTNASYAAVAPAAASMTIVTSCATQGNRSPAYVSLAYYA
jgi:hypothetical protein